MKVGKSTLTSIYSMRVIFDYIKTEKGHKLNMKCEDMPKIEGSEVIDPVEYNECMKAIYNDLKRNQPGVAE